MTLNNTNERMLTMSAVLFLASLSQLSVYWLDICCLDVIFSHNVVIKGVFIIIMSSWLMIASTMTYIERKESSPAAWYILIANLFLFMAVTL